MMKPEENDPETIALLREIFGNGPEPDPDTDPIAITHEQDDSLEEDEMIIHTMIEPNKENPE